MFTLMGKHTRRNQSGDLFENHDPGCMWVMLHALNNHNWRHVKKMLPHKRRGYGKHAGVQNQGDEMQENSGAKMDNSANKEESSVSSRATRFSVKSRIKARFDIEVSRRKGKHQRSSTSPAQLQIPQTDSAHHLKASDEKSVPEVILNAEIPRYVSPNNETTSSSSASCEPINSEKKCVIFANTLLQERLEIAKQSSLEQKLMCLKEQTGDASLYQSKDFLDALNNIKLDKDLSMKVLQDQGSPLDQQDFSSKIGLSKSGSFPLGKRVIGPCEFEQKLKDIKICEKEDKFEQKNPCISETNNMVNENTTADQARPEMLINASPSSTLLMSARGNQIGAKHFKNLKQRIQHAIIECKKESHRITMDAVLHRIPYGRHNELKKETVELTTGSPASSYDSDHSCPVYNKRKLHPMRRTSSVTDSIHRYCQLYQNTFHRESRNNTSQKFKLRKEEVSCSKGRESLGRIFSLPDLKSYCYEDSSDALSSGTPVGSTNRKIHLDTLLESETKENVIEENEMKIDIDDKTGSSPVEFGDINTEMFSEIPDYDDFNPRNASYHEWETGSLSKLASKLPESSSVFLNDSISQQDIDHNANFSISKEGERWRSHDEFVTETVSFLTILNRKNASPRESIIIIILSNVCAKTETDSQCKPEHYPLDGPDFFANQHESSMGSPALAENIVDLKKVEVSINELLGSDSLHFQVSSKNNGEFNYVRDVLEHSGLMTAEFLKTWHTPDQPLDPSVYEQVENDLPLEEECSENEEAVYSNNHLLLFDLINEVLMGIYDRSFSYCPIPFSSRTHVRPMPVGTHVLEEVWRNISWYLNSKPEFDQAMDYLVSRDLSKGDGWMNLQFDAECVGLELEGLIFDDLLEDIFCD